MKAADICNALVKDGQVFSRRRWVVVPNVSWGWGLDYEADLIAISKNGYANEVEIKISKGDLRQDRHKRKFTSATLDPRIKSFWYAVPTALVETALNPAIVAPRFGIVEIYELDHGTTRALPDGSIQHVPVIFRSTRIIRRATPRPDCKPVSDADIRNLMRLGLLRYWDLRQQTKSEETP